MATKSKAIEATAPKRLVRWGELAAGTIGVSAGLAAVAIEIGRNYEFGASKGPIVGATYALFAIGLAAVPAVASKTGWTAMLRILFVICFCLTGFFGVAYYAKGILDKANQAATATEQYRDARQEKDAAERTRAAAQAEADGIAERTGPEELEALAKQADADAQLEAGNKFCGDKCRAYRVKADGYRERLGLAKAKAAALARVAKAEARLDQATDKAKNGAVDGNPLATLVAMQTGGDAGALAGSIDLFEPIAMVIGMLFFAALIDGSLSLVIRGLGFRENAAVAAVEAPTAAKTVPAVAEPAKPALPRGRPALTPEQRLERFIAQHLQAGFSGDAPSAKIYEAYTVYLACFAPGDQPLSPIAFGKALSARGFRSEKVGGARRYRGVKLVPIGAN